MTFPIRVFALALLVGLLSGCGKTGSTDGKTTEIPAPGSLFVPTVEAAEVRGEDFVEDIELPGVWVQGMESTPLFAKVGGFVKEIRRVGHADYDGQAVQITDTLDRQTYRVRDIEFRVVGSPPQGGMNKPVHAADPDELKSMWLKLHAAWKEAEMMELDIGSNVEAGTLLAVLDIPEMADDLKKQEAAVERAKQTVLQKAAAVRSAGAQVGQAKADFVKAERTLERDEKELARIERLRKSGNVDLALLEQVQYKVAASKAAVDSAGETVKVAKAAVEKAEADQKVADAHVREADAEISRLKTLKDYAFIRAPFTGTITRRFVDHGAFVQPAEGNSGAKPLFAVTQTDKVRVVIPVPGRKSFKIRTGQDVVFHTIGGLPGVTVKGRIDRSAETLDPESRMMRVEMYLKNPATNSRLIRDGRGWKPRAQSETKTETKTVRPGMFGVATVRNKWERLRMIPATALAGKAGEQYVLEIVDAGDGKLQVVQRFVTVVFNDAKTAGVSDGVAVGAQVVATGVSSLQDGQKVLRKKE